MKIDDIKILKSNKNIDWSSFNNKTIYISGATGLIGSNLVNALLACSNAKIVVQIRNKKKAYKLFGEKVDYVVCDILDKPIYTENVDYIIHCANPTSSKYFIDYPVDTINTAINGTFNLLEFAKEKNVTSFVFLSTMEVYGIKKRGHKIKENESGSFDSSVVRNCYPLSKQTCENLCVAYKTQFKVPTRVLRLTQTFGPGVSYDDNRVFAEFARCIIENRNIILKTRGKTERSYLYTIDAVSAILTVLLKGSDGEIYTAANENTYCSIYDMAKMVAELGNIQVIIEEQDVAKFGYADTLYMNLDTSKLKNLGWYPYVNLKEMYLKLIESLKKSE